MGPGSIYLIWSLLCRADPEHAGRLIQRAPGAKGAEGPEGMGEERMSSRNVPITLILAKDDFINLFKACEDRREKLDHLQEPLMTRMSSLRRETISSR